MAQYQGSNTADIGLKTGGIGPGETVAKNAEQRLTELKRELVHSYSYSFYISITDFTFKEPRLSSHFPSPLLYPPFPWCDDVITNYRRGVSL